MKLNFKKFIASRLNDLNTAEPSFKAIYNLTFSSPELIMAEDNDGITVRRYTYGEIKERIEKTAGALYSLLGATHSYVGVSLENGVDWIVVFWGVLKSGNKPYLVNLRHPQALSNRIIKNLNITNIVCDKEGDLDASYIALSSLDGGECPDVFEDEIAIASSGTSLSETVCFYSGENVCAQIRNTEKIVKENKNIYAHYKGELKQLAFLPFYHVFGLFAVYFWFTFFQRTLVFLRDMSPETILFTCKEHKVTHIFAVPMLWHTIEDKVKKAAAKQGREEKLNKGIALCNKIQNLFPTLGTYLAKKIMGSVTKEMFGDSLLFCISGGSFLRTSALGLINGIGYPLHNGYGMSEIGIASVDLSKKADDRNKNSIGRPFSSVEYKIDQNGVLWVKGISLCKETLKEGKRTVTDGWFCTGDICETDSDGRYYIKGRISDTVIGENGENLNPDIIEQMFSPSGVQNMSVIGINDKLTMVVQVSPYLSAARVDKIREELESVNSTLPAVQQIKKFYMTSDPIMEPTAIKVSRKYLALKIKEGEIKLSPIKKEQTEGGFDKNSPLAQKVISIVARVIEEEEENIDVQANLLVDMGISSLQYFSVLSAVSEEFGITAEQGGDYCYSVKEFCEYIERQL